VGAIDLDQAPDPNAAPADGTTPAAPPGTPGATVTPAPQQQQPSNGLF
jgi:hypothetical protein